MALQTLALLLLALHLVVYLALPPSPPNTVPDAGSLESAWWGLWPVHYLAPWQVLLGAAAVPAAIAAGWLLRTRRSAAPSPRPAVQWGALAAVTALLVAAFYLFPLAHTRWGDAFMLANGLALPDPALRITHSWQAPLDVFLHSQVWAALHGPLGWEDAAPAYRLLSPLAGLLYLLAALALSRDLQISPHRVPPWLTCGLLATLGLLQLFFGYVENYSFAAAGVLAYLWLGLRAAAGRRPLWQAATLLALVNATHPSTVILAPSLLYLGWIGWRRGNYSLLRVVGEVALPMLLIGGATFVWMEASGHGLYALFNTDRPGGGDARWFVPLWETTTRWEHYTLFSWPHLRDWLNQQLLVAPVVLPALAIVAISLWRAAAHGRVGAPAPHEGVRATREDVRATREDVRATREDVWATREDAWAAREDGRAAPEDGRAAPGDAPFLLLAAGFYLLFTLLWNPDYGGQRDWDLFSLAALPATVLLAVLLPRSLGARRWLAAGALPLLVVQGWSTWAWIVQNTQPWQWPD